MPGLADWLAAFWELSTDRQAGMGYGPVPAASIDRWAARYPGQEMEFRKAIRRMDQAFLAHVNKRDAEATEPAPKDLPQLTPGGFKAMFGKKGAA